MDLHKEFVKLSFDIIKMKNKLISLLLEIYEKEIYKQHGCKTIYEYGFNYAKLSKEMVDKAVRTLKHLENKPFLKKVLETQGIHKVAMVATIATSENERIFAKHVENMSKPALFEFTKELRHKQKNGKISGQFCQAVPGKMQIELDAEMQTLFLKFKEKYAKDFSNQEGLKIILKKFNKMEEKAGFENNLNKKMPEKARVVKQNSVKRKSVPGNGNDKMSTGRLKDNILLSNNIIIPPSRHIPISQKREILQKYHQKCAYPGCVKTPENMHHRVPFSFERNHNSIIPLCKVHHEFAHNGLIAHELKQPENWELKTEGQRSIFDQFYIIKRHSGIKGLPFS